MNIIRYIIFFAALNIVINNSFAAPGLSSAPATAYIVPENLLKSTNDFFSETKNIALNQGNFGTCETFSLVGLIGYIDKHDVNAYSPYYALMQTYQLSLNKGQGINKSNWWGQQTFGWTLSNLKDSLYNNTTEAVNYYQVLQDEAIGVDTGYKSNVVTLPSWNQGYNNFKQQNSVPFPSTIIPNQYSLYDYSDWSSNPSDTVRSQKIINSLDAGHKVIILIQFMYRWAPVVAKATIDKAIPGWTGTLTFHLDKTVNLSKTPISFDISDNVNVYSVWGISGYPSFTQNGNTVTVKTNLPSMGDILEAEAPIKLSFSASAEVYTVSNIRLGTPSPTLLVPWGNEGDYYFYDSKGTINRAPYPSDPVKLNTLAPFTTKNNTGWTCYVDSGHYLEIISYAKSTSDNQILFVARNSWGPNRGQNGNFFLTDWFVNNHSKFAAQFNQHDEANH